MKQESDVIDEVIDAIVEEARASGLAVLASRSERDGYGMVGVSVIEVTSDSRAEPIRLWHEHGLDFWVEFGTGIPDAAWWSKGKDLGVLAQVIAAALAGQVDVIGGRVTVRVKGRRPLRLAERL